MNHRALYAITLGHISVDMHTSSLAIMLPLLLTQFDLTYAAAAGIITANNIIVAVAQPLFGIAGDYRSYKWMVWVGVGLCGLAMVSVLWWSSYPMVIAAVLISGLGSALFHPEGLVRARAVMVQRPATAVSVFFSGGNIGFALGPILAIFLLERMGKPGGLLMLIPSALALIFIANQWKAIRGVEGSGKKVVRNLSEPNRAGLASFLLLLVTLRSTVAAGLGAFIPLYFFENGQLSREGAAFLVTLLSISGTVGTLSGGMLAERFGRRLTLIVSIVLGFLFLQVFMHSGGWLRAVALALSGMSTSVVWPLIIVMMQESLPRNLGLAGGLSMGTSYAASGLGVALLGLYADAYGLASTMTLIGWLPLGICLLTFFVPKQIQKPVVQQEAGSG